VFHPIHGTCGRAILLPNILGFASSIFLCLPSAARLRTY